MNFYDLGGSLVRRRRIPVSDGVSVELWNGTTWEPLGAIEHVLRLANRLSDEGAIQLLHETRVRHDEDPLPDSEARGLLRAPGEVVPTTN